MPEPFSPSPFAGKLPPSGVATSSGYKPEDEPSDGMTMQQLAGRIGATYHEVHNYIQTLEAPKGQVRLVSGVTRKEVMTPMTMKTLMTAMSQMTVRKMRSPSFVVTSTPLRLRTRL